MAMSDAERQKKYRDTRKGESLLAAWVPTATIERLRQIAALNQRSIKQTLTIIIRDARP